MRGSCTTRWQFLATRTCGIISGACGRLSTEKEFFAPSTESLKKEGHNKKMNNTKIMLLETPFVATLYCLDAEKECFSGWTSLQ